MASQHAPAEVRLGRRQLFMLPTRFGLLFTLLLAVQLMTAINYGNGLAYALTFLLGSLGVVSMLYTHHNLSGLYLSPGISPPVFAGDTAVFKIHVANNSSTPRYAVTLKQDKNEFAWINISANSSANIELRVPTVKRGYLALPPVTVTTRFPLGLLYSWSRRITLGQSCLVYPAPAPPTPFQTASAVSPEFLRGIKRGGDDYIGTREFRPGDSPRHVDWKAVARGEGWRIKQFGGGTQASLWLDFDALVGLNTETRLSLLTRWVLEAEQENLLYGLRMPKKIISPANGVHHHHTCLRVLALFGTNHE